MVEKWLLKIPTKPPYSEVGSTMSTGGSGGFINLSAFFLILFSYPNITLTCLGFGDIRIASSSLLLVIHSSGIFYSHKISMWIL